MVASTDTSWSVVDWFMLQGLASNKNVISYGHCSSQTRTDMTSNGMCIIHSQVEQGQGVG